jgi:thioredoxin-related protein
MKKILLGILLVGSLLQADKKPIFIMVYDQSCNACNQTISLIARNKELGNTITTLTKPFQMTVQEAEQNNLLVRSVPTFFLLDPNTNKMLVKPLEGAIKDPQDFTRFLKQIHSALNQ